MKHVLSIATFLWLFQLVATSQISIGIKETAAPGALLQLKNIPKEEIIDRVNSTKGLLLPRVGITDLYSLVNITPDSDPRPNAEEHTGLVVYNINEDLCSLPSPIREGLHVWKGTKWELLDLTPLYSDKVEFYTDQNGNEFRARTFGNAGTWMIENLRATKLADNLGGTPLIDASEEPVPYNKNIKFAYGYPGMDKKYFDENPALGLLYDWQAASNNKTRILQNENVENGVEKGNAVQGICPEGWHLPTIAEWIELEKEIIKNSTDYSSQSGLTEPAEGLKPNDPFNGKLSPEAVGIIYARGDHGLAMQSSCNVPDESAPNNATGSSIYDGGFSVMMAGYVYTLSGAIHDRYKQEAYFHTSSLTNQGNPDKNTNPSIVCRSFYLKSTNNAEISTRPIAQDDNGGYLSVRCKKN